MNYKDEPEAFAIGCDIGYGFGRPALAWSTAIKPETYPEDASQRRCFLEGYEVGVDYRLQEHNQE